MASSEARPSAESAGSRLPHREAAGGLLRLSVEQIRGRKSVTDLRCVHRRFALQTDHERYSDGSQDVCQPTDAAEGRAPDLRTAWCKEAAAGPVEAAFRTRWHRQR